MGDSSDSVFISVAVGSGRLTRAHADMALAVRQAAKEQGSAPPSVQKVILDRGWMTPEQVSEVIAQIGGGPHKAGRIEGYRLLAKVAQGGMGTVYKAIREATGEVVALKILPRRTAQKPDSVERFLRESRVLAKINSDHIVKTVDGGFSGGYYYYAMEFVEGESVDTTLSIDGAMSESQALGIVHQVSLALRDAELAGMVHRDIKPGNILVREDGVAKLTDFGLAHEIDEETEAPNGMTLGTPSYMSPEQARGVPLDVRSDIYSLGVTFYYMVTGTVPFKGDTSQLTMLKHLNEQPVAPITRRPDLSPGCNDVILKMLAKDRGERYRHADELIHDLELVMEGKPAEFTAPAGKAPAREAKGGELGGETQVLSERFGEEMQTQRRLRWLKISILVIAAALIGALICVWVTHRRP